MTTLEDSLGNADYASTQESGETNALSASDAAYERETTIVMSDGDPLVRISTMQRTVITALRKKDAFTEVKSGFFDKTEWADFTIPREKFNLAKAVKATVNLTDEQREERRRRGKAAAEHLAKYRKANS